MIPTLRALLLLCLVVGLPRITPADVKPPEKAAETFEMTREEKEILDLTNAERARVKLPPLKPLPILFKVARAHSANMAKQDKMEHVLDGKQPWQRVLDAGYKAPWVGENIGAGEEFGPKEVMKAWMESEGHRKNILDKTYTEIGIGMATSAKGEIYSTQVFSRPPRQR